ncbi:MAG: alpha/beta fold hydrolase [Mycobacterium sp.]|nr:alpha/beta fold hydrolase [Mycobacterium sp.]
MSVPLIGGSVLGGVPQLPSLVVGPSLGTTVKMLWSPVAGRIADSYHVIGWDLPGHGASPPPREPFTIGDLAAGVIHWVDETIGAVPFTYAGVSVAGAVGLQLLLDWPQRLLAAAPIGTAAQIGTPADWKSRAETVRRAGTRALMAQSAQRWFDPAFSDRDPGCVRTLLGELEGVDDVGYAQVCAALADFDVRARLAQIDIPVLAVAGANDIVTRADSLRFISANVRCGRFAEVADAAHLAPVEQPDQIATLLTAMTKRRCDD